MCGVRTAGASCTMLNIASAHGTLVTSGLKLWKEKLNFAQQQKYKAALRIIHFAERCVEIIWAFMIVGVKT